MLSSKEGIIEWNNRFPLDLWYRRKYQIPFGSKKHREINYVDIYFEYSEDNLFKKFELEEEELNKKKERLTISGQVFTKTIYKELTEKETDDIFDTLDLSQFNQEEPPQQENA